MFDKNNGRLIHRNLSKEVWDCGDHIVKIRSGATGRLKYEHDIMEELYTNGFDRWVPKPIEYYEADGKGYLVMSRIPGYSLGSSYLSTSQKRAVIAQLRDFMRGYSRFVSKVATRARIEDVIGEVSPVAYEEGLVHGDLHPGNVMVYNGELSGVIDWESCYYGALVVECYASGCRFPVPARYFVSLFADSDYFYELLFERVCSRREEMMKSAESKSLVAIAKDNFYTQALFLPTRIMTHIEYNSVPLVSDMPVVQEGFDTSLLVPIFRKHRMESRLSLCFVRRQYKLEANEVIVQGAAEDDIAPRKYSYELFPRSFALGGMTVFEMSERNAVFPVPYDFIKDLVKAIPGGMLNVLGLSYVAVADS